MAEDGHQLENPRPQEQLAPDITEALDLAQQLEPHLGPEFKFHEPIQTLIATALHPATLELDPRGAHVLTAGTWDAYLGIMNVAPSQRTHILAALMRRVDSWKKTPANPHKAWMNMICQESAIRSLETLPTSYGIHGYQLEVENSKLTIGQTMQKTLAKLYIEIIATNSLGPPTYVNMPLEETPDHRKLVAQSQGEVKKASQGSCSWQKNNPLLKGPMQPDALAAQIYDYLINVHNGGLDWRIPKTMGPHRGKVDIESMAVRFFSHDMYCDVPIKDILNNPNPDALIANIRNTQSIPVTASEVPEDFSWTWRRVTTAPIDFTVRQNAVISVSLDQQVSHDSLPQLISRTGAQACQLMFREHNGTIEVDWFTKHENINGLPAEEVAFSLGVEIGANKPSLPKEEILWFPSMPRSLPDEYRSLMSRLRDPGKKILNNPENLQALCDILEHSSDPLHVTNEPLLQRLIDDLELSDVVIATTRPPSLLNAVKGFSSAADTTYLAPLRKKLTNLMDALHLHTSEEARNHVLKRIITTEFTSIKANSLISRLFWGPSAICGISNNPAHGISLVTANLVDEAMRDDVVSQASENTLSTKTLFHRTPKTLEHDQLARENYPQWIRNRLKQVLENMCVQYAHLFFGTSPLMVLKEVSEGNLRPVNETIAAVSHHKLVDETGIIDQQSVINPGVKVYKNGRRAAIKRFISAFAAEPKLVMAEGIMKSENGTGTTMRMRLTGELLQAMDLTSPHFRDTILPQLPALLAPEAPERQEEIRRQATEALELWDTLLEQSRPKPASGIFAKLEKFAAQKGWWEMKSTISPAMIVAEILKSNPNMLRGTQYLLLAGMVGMKERYFHASEVIANRLTEIIIDHPQTPTT